MSQIQKSKTKSKKSYADLLEEFASVKKRIAVAYVPLLCEAMKDENPEMNYMDIKDKVVGDAVEQGWNEPYIVRCLPSWIVEADPKRDMHHLRALKVAESKRNNKNLELKVLKLAQEPFTEPPQPKERESEPVNDEELHDMGMGSYGEGDNTIYGIRRDAHQYGRMFFKTLCDDNEPPVSVDEDLVRDYIKPTREFRLNVAFESNETERASLHNLMHNIIEIAEDMIDQIDKADKK
jgi:hypothetical protein